METRIPFTSRRRSECLALLLPPRAETHVLHTVDLIDDTGIGAERPTWFLSASDPHLQNAGDNTQGDMS